MSKNFGSLTIFEMVGIQGVYQLCRLSLNGLIQHALRVGRWQKARDIGGQLHSNLTTCQILGSFGKDPRTSPRKLHRTKKEVRAIDREMCIMCIGEGEGGECER